MKKKTADFKWRTANVKNQSSNGSQIDILIALYKFDPATSCASDQLKCTHACTFAAVLIDAQNI